VQVRARLKRTGKDAFYLDVDLELPAGITVLFGPSGSGKSTALMCAAGLVRPDEGRIALGDDVWFDSAAGIDKPVHRRGVAYVFQSLALFPHMSALHNVAYGIDRALAKDERMARAQHTLDRVRVAHLAHRRPRTFSGGEAQRVALARAFAMSPRIILLDEVFSGLDRDLRRELALDVRRFVDDTGVPAVLVTHHRSEARALGDRVHLFERGRVTASGGVKELLPDDRGDTADLVSRPPSVSLRAADGHAVADRNDHERS
jgi:molybdate transport system ATP-binding protein